jgi:hypothetical protein
MVSRLPDGVRRLDDPEEYPVTISDGLAARREAIRAAR